jgi:HAD superfamily hydrolase (TIGR01509 family)
MKKQFAAIFLDNDGILVDTEKFYAEASDEISQDLFGIEIPLKTYQTYGYIKGTGTSQFLKEQGIPNKKIENYKIIKDSLYEEKISQNIKPLPGVIDFLKIIKSREILTAVVTAAPRRHFLQINNQTGLLTYFKFWVVNEDVEESKPSPECYLLAAKKAGVDPADCLVIEDSPRGIIAGKKAGMTVYAIPTEQTKNLDLSLADKIFAGFMELIKENNFT